MQQQLIPILLAGEGRSGTTALMALLGTDPRVAFDRVYPFENRYLTWMAKSALVVGRPVNTDVLTAELLFEFGDDHLGPMPRSMEQPSPLMPSVETWMAGLWQMFTQNARQNDRTPIYYAEKSPYWLPALMRRHQPIRVLHLVRDPRDVFISARKFMRPNGAVQFGLSSGMTEVQMARETAHRWLIYAENELADVGCDNSMVVRYEDWVLHPQETADRIGQFLGLNLRTDAPELTRDLHRHKTSGDLAASVHRWKREPISAGANSQLVGLLADHLDRYGYERPNNVTWNQAIIPDPAWSHSDDGQWTRDENGARVTICGTDAWIEMPAAPFEAQSVAEIWLCLSGETGDHCSIYWRGKDQPFAQERSEHLRFFPGSQFQILRIRVKEHPKWHGMIEQLRVDVCNGTIVIGAKCQLRWIRLVA